MKRGKKTEREGERGREREREREKREDTDRGSPRRRLWRPVYFRE